MRLKKPALVVTFAATADAMAMERYCMERNLPGRLIPIPREIHAGCGLAWKLLLLLWKMPASAGKPWKSWSCGAKKYVTHKPCCPPGQHGYV